MPSLCLRVKYNARNACSQRYFCSEKIYLHSKAGSIARSLQCISSLLILFCKWDSLKFTHKSRNSFTTEIPVLQFPSDSPCHHDVTHHVWASALLRRVGHWRCLRTTAQQWSKALQRARDGEWGWISHFCAVTSAYNATAERSSV